MKVVVVGKKFTVNNLSKYWEIRHNGAKKGISNQPGKPDADGENNEYREHFLWYSYVAMAYVYMYFISTPMSFFLNYIPFL